VKKRKLVAIMAGVSLAILASRKLEREGVRLEGEFLGVPYDFRPPTLGKIRERCWNPDDPRLLTPHIFGWGWMVNFYALAQSLGLLPQPGSAQCVVKGDRRGGNRLMAVLRGLESLS